MFLDPFKRALSNPQPRAYADRYGARAAQAAEACRIHAQNGDTHRQYIAQISLSMILHRDCAHLFAEPKRNQTH